MVLAIAAFAFGTVTGLRCSVFTLLPAIVAVTGLHVAMDGPALARAGSAIVCIACIQGGYMVGLTARDAIRQTLARLSASFRST